MFNLWNKLDVLQDMKCTECGKEGGIHKITHVYKDEVKILCCPCYIKWGGGAFCNGVNCTLELGFEAEEKDLLRTIVEGNIQIVELLTKIWNAEKSV